MSQSNDEPKEFSGYIHKKEGLEFDVSEIEELAKDMAVSQLWPWDKISEDMRINFRMYASNMFKKGYRKTSQMHPDTTPWNNGGKMVVEFLNKNLWEYFCDESYYHLWAVRLKLETEFGQSFHVRSEEEAKGLCDLLNNCQQKAVEYVPLDEGTLSKFLVDIMDLHPNMIASMICEKFSSVKDNSNA